MEYLRRIVQSRYNTPNIQQNTVGCLYNAVQYNMILHTSLQWLRPNINQSLSILYFVKILEKIDRVIKAPHSIYKEIT